MACGATKTLGCFWTRRRGGGRGDRSEFRIVAQMAAAYNNSIIEENLRCQKDLANQPYCSDASPMDAPAASPDEQQAWDAEMHGEQAVYDEQYEQHADLVPWLLFKDSVCVECLIGRNQCPAMGGLQISRWLGSDPLLAWWLGLAPATLEFWVRFPNERNQGKQAHPVLKYRVPHGSHRVR